MNSKVISVDLLEFLLNSPDVFQNLSLPVKQNLVSKRPTPINLNIVSFDGDEIIHFDPHWYSMYEWLTGSLQRNKLFCFVCLVMEQCTNVSDLFSSLTNFHKKARAHENSKSHLRNMDKYITILVNHNKHSVTTGQYKTHKERQLVKNYIRFLANENQNIHGSVFDVENPLKDSIIFSSQNEIAFPSDWETYLTNITDKMAQSEILGFLHESVQDYIKNEILISDCVSVQIDDMSDFTCKPLFSVIFRYVTNNKVVERFVGYFEIPNDHSTDFFTETVFNFVREWKAEDKLVSVSSDSPATRLSSEKLQERNALLLHNANYSLNMALFKSTLTHRKVKEFAGQVALITSFFTDAKREMRFSLDGFSLPKELSEPGACLETCILVLKTKFEDLLLAVVHVLESENWDLETECLARYIQDIMLSETFPYLICLFSKVFSLSEHLTSVIRFVSFKNLKMCIEEIGQYSKNLKEISSSSTMRKLHAESLKLKGSTDKPSNFKTSVFPALHDSISSLLLEELLIRFADLSKLELFQLLDEQHFKSYNKTFPYKNFSNLTSSYTIFDIERLETELSVIYEDESKHLPPRELLNHICSNGLENVYEETIKFIRLFLTTPIFVAEEDAEKRTYEKVKKFAKNVSTLEMFSIQGMLVIEEEILRELLNDDNFMDRFFDAYSQKSKYFHSPIKMPC